MIKFNWGIIGTGNIARSFSEALRGNSDSVPYAVASRSLEKAQQFAAEFGFIKAYGSYAELAADPELDAVYIATPMASHYNDALLCLNSGKNVLCEKTVTLNSSQLEILLSLAEEKGLFFMEAMWMKCRPVYLKAKEWAQSGRIGEIRCIKADFSNRVPFDPNSRLFRSDCGGGALLDVSVYPLTLAADFLGNEPDEIISTANIRNGIDLSNSIILRYGNASVSAYSGFELALSNNALISGTDGAILFDDYFFCTDRIFLYDRNMRQTEQFTAQNDINGYEYEIREFQRCLSSGLTDSPLVPHNGTTGVMRIMDDCRRQWGLRYPNE